MNLEPKGLGPRKGSKFDLQQDGEGDILRVSKHILMCNCVKYSQTSQKAMIKEMTKCGNSCKLIWKLMFLLFKDKLLIMLSIL